VELACTAQEYFTLCLADDSKFIEDYCAERKDTDLQVEQWRHVADKKGGMARMVTYRSLCHSPMCPPDTAVTVWQNVTFSDDKKVLVGCHSLSPHAYKHHAICSIVFFCTSLIFVVL
jgi:hypothetical protein